MVAASLTALCVTSKEHRSVTAYLVQKGTSFAAICEAIAIANSSSDQVALIGQLLARWLADGIIVRADAMLLGSAVAP
jgi:hypothetical protein